MNIIEAGLQGSASLFFHGKMIIFVKRLIILKYFITMKKYKLRILLAALVMLPLLLSCTVNEPELPVREQQNYEYRFSIVETKATLGENGVFWESGDQVGLFAGGEASAAAGVDVTTTPKSIVYSTGEPLEAGTNVYAYYPYQEGNTVASATKVTIPALQSGGTRSAMPMAAIPFAVTEGEGTQGAVHFLNLGSVIDFRIYSTKYAGELIKSITVSVTSGTHAISGEASIDLTSVTPSDESSLALSWTAGAESTVKLSQSGTVATSKDAAVAAGPMFMVVAPGTYSGTITVATNVAIYTFTFADKEFSRNFIKGFNMNLDNAARESWYVKINSASDLVDGGKYLIVYESGSVAFKPILSGNTMTASASNKFAVTIEDNTIKSTSANGVDDCQIILEAGSTSGSYYLKAVNADGYYFYPTSSNIAAGASRSTPVSITVNSGVVNITAGSNNYFKYSTSSNYFKQSTYDNSRELALYLLDGSRLKPQNLLFSQTSFIYDISGQELPIDDVEGAPQLSGAITPVSYTSDNTAVATVDPSSGALTINGEGTASITATAEADDTYLAASASYRLTVSRGPVFRLEGDKMAQFLDYMDDHPYDPSDYSYSYVEQFSNTKSQTNRLDMPKPVTLTWTSTQTGTMSAAVYYDSAHTQQETMAYVKFSSTANSVDIYNLIPNRHYYYEIKAGSTVVASGEFNTVGHRRILNVADSQFGNCYANNCRDLGGLETTDGRTVKYGKIFRGTNMDKTTSAQQDYIKNVMGVELDVDLRYNEGQTSSDNSYMVNALNLAQIPASTSTSNTSGTYVGHTRETYNSITDLTTAYKMGPTLTRIINAAENGKGVYIHCKVGADRTGFVCMMLEAILGVKQELCDVDYELTSFCAAVDGGNYRRRNDTSKDWYYYPRGVDIVMNRLGGQPGVTFQEKAIDYAVNVLGVPAERITAFQNCMLESSQQ